MIVRRRVERSRAGALAGLVVGGLLAFPALAERPRVYGIQNASIVTAPGTTIDDATIVLRDGLIEAVGRRASVPADAVVIDGSGTWIYPGLIDPNTDLGQDVANARGGSPFSAAGGSGPPAAREARDERSPGAGHPNSRVTPQTRAADSLAPFTGERTRDAERYRELGFAAVLSAPRSGIFRGTSSVILLLDDVEVPALIVRNDVFQHLAFERGRFGSGYPTSLMGTVALIRQVVRDAERFAVWSSRYAKNPKGMTRPERSDSLAALAPLLAGPQRAMFHVESAQDALLADRLGRELGLPAIIAASGEVWQIADQIRQTGRPLVVSVAFPDKPEVDDEHERLDVTLQDLRRYVRAPAAPARLHESGIRFAFTTSGLKSLTDFRKNLRKIIDAGLPEEAALAALTIVPAELLGIDAIAGTLEPGKLANLVQLDGPLFAEASKMTRVFVDGVEYRVEEKKPPAGGDPDAVVDPRGEWSVVFEVGGRSVERRWTIEGSAGSYRGTAETQSGTVAFDEIRLLGNMLTVVFPALGGRSSMEVTVVIRGEAFEGSVEFGPRSAPIRGTRTRGPDGGGR